MPLRRARTTRGRRRFGGTRRRRTTSRKPTKRGIYSKRKAVRSANTVRKIARKAAANVIRDKRPLLHRRFNLDANANGYQTLVHNQWQGYFVTPHATGQPYSGGLCELAGQGSSGVWPQAPQYLGVPDNATTRRIPLCEEPGAVPGCFRTHKWIEGAAVHLKLTFTQFNDRCGGMVRIMILMYRQGATSISQDDLIMQTNCSSTTVLPAQNLYDAPQRPRQYRSERIRILKDMRISLKQSGGDLYGLDPDATLTNAVNGERQVNFRVKLPKKFYYDNVDKMVFDPDTSIPSKWNVGFYVCAYGGNEVPAATNICRMTCKGDLTWRNPL